MALNKSLNLSELKSISLPVKRDEQYLVLVSSGLKQQHRFPCWLLVYCLSTSNSPFLPALWKWIGTLQMFSLYPLAQCSTSSVMGAGGTLQKEQGSSSIQLTRYVRCTRTCRAGQGHPEISAFTTPSSGNCPKNPSHDQRRNFLEGRFPVSCTVPQQLHYSCVHPKTDWISAWSSRTGALPWVLP